MTMMADRACKRNSSAGERGFTLIEVMVVVLIIGILLAIGIPTFLGARERAQDRSAEAALRVARTTGVALFTDGGDFRSPIDELNEAEPGYTWIGARDLSTDDTEISVWNWNGYWAAAVLSDSGTYFYLYMDRQQVARLGTSTADLCDGRYAAGARVGAW